MPVEEIIAKVFNVDPGELDDLSSRDTIPGWDSMGHLTLITALEEHFGVKISIANAMEMVSVGKIKEILRGYKVNC